jgi:hypothetical protein
MELLASLITAPIYVFDASEEMHMLADYSLWAAYSLERHL